MPRVKAHHHSCLGKNLLQDHHSRQLRQSQQTLLTWTGSPTRPMRRLSTPSILVLYRLVTTAKQTVEEIALRLLRQALDPPTRPTSQRTGGECSLTTRRSCTSMRRSRARLEMKRVRRDAAANRRARKFRLRASARRPTSRQTRICFHRPLRQRPVQTRLHQSILLTATCWSTRRSFASKRWRGASWYDARAFVESLSLRDGLV